MANLNIQYLLQAATLSSDPTIQKLGEAIEQLVGEVKQLQNTINTLSSTISEGPSSLVEIPYNISFIPDYRIPKQIMKMTGPVNVAATLGIDEYSTILFMFQADGTARLVQLSPAYQTSVALFFTVNPNCFSVVEFQGTKDTVTGAITLKMINSLFNQPI